MDWSWRVCNRTVVQGFGRNLAELFFVFFFFLEIPTLKAQASSH